MPGWQTFSILKQAERRGSSLTGDFSGDDWLAKACKFSWAWNIKTVKLSCLRYTERAIMIWRVKLLSRL